MSGWLVDTNVLSAFAPGRPGISLERAEWFRERADRLFLSTVTAMEIQAGIARLRRTGAASRAASLRGWFDRVLEQYAERVLAFDLGAAIAAGAIDDAARAEGRHPGFADIAIAGIAQSRGLVILTMNLRHFAPLGVEASNPFAAVG